jgi:hypothetical protein
MGESDVLPCGTQLVSRVPASWSPLARLAVSSENLLFALVRSQLGIVVKAIQRYRPNGDSVDVVQPVKRRHGASPLERPDESVHGEFVVIGGRLAQSFRLPGILPCIPGYSSSGRL